MGTLDKQGVVTMQELLVSSLATADAVASLGQAPPRIGCERVGSRIKRLT